MLLKMFLLSVEGNLKTKKGSCHLLFLSPNCYAAQLVSLCGALKPPRSALHGAIASLAL